MCEGVRGVKTSTVRNIKTGRAPNRRVAFVLIRPLTIAGRFDMSVAFTKGDDAKKATNGQTIGFGASANYKLRESLSVQLDLIYAMTSFEFEEGGTASFHTIEFPLLARYTAWEMYGVVPRASLGLNLGANASASVDLEDAATQGVDVSKRCVGFSDRLHHQFRRRRPNGLGRCRCGHSVQAWLYQSD